MKKIFIPLLASFMFSNLQALKKGDKAPDFTLCDEDGNKIALSDYKGSNVALYFYPMDGTYGCTKQACSLRDGFSDLKKAKITIIGISSDSSKSHKKFKEKNRLPFVLLSDVGQKVADLYGVTRGFLFSWIGVKRVTFLIDKDGYIIDVLKKIELKDHAQQIINIFKESKNINKK